MTTALFSIECPTCRRRLKVRHQAAIGQILPCPKCGSMLQVMPPQDWQPAADELPDTLASGVMPSRDETSPRTVDGAVGPWSEPITADDQAATPESAPPASRRWLAISAALLLALVGSAAGWVLFVDRKTITDRSLAAAAQDPRAKQAPAEPAADDDAPSATAPADTVAPSDELPPASNDDDVRATQHLAGDPSTPADATDEKPTAAETSESVDTDTAESPPPESIAASETPIDAPTNVESPAGEPEPTVIPLSIATVLPREPLPEVSAEAQWRQPIAGLQLDQLPLSRFARLMSRLSGCPLRIDLESLAAGEIEVEAPVTLRVDDTTLGEVLEAGLASLDLTAIEHDASATIVASRVEVALEERSYPWSEFDEKSPETFVERLTKLVAPHQWGPTTSASATPEALVVRQSPAVHRAIADFLQRLGQAREHAARGERVGHEPAAAETLLDTEVSVNFRPAQRLEVALDQMARLAGLRLVLDGAALAEAGVSLDEPVAMSAVREPLAEALDVALLPLGLSYRLAEPNILEVTSWSRAALSSMPRVIDIGPLTTRPEDGLAVALDYGAFAREHGRPPSASPDAAVVVFDPASKCLLVRAPYSATRKIAGHVASRLDALEAR